MCFMNEENLFTLHIMYMYISIRIPHSACSRKYDNIITHLQIASIKQSSTLTQQTICCVGQMDVHGQIQTHSDNAMGVGEG